MENSNLQEAGHDKSTASGALHLLEKLKSTLEADDQEIQGLRRTMQAKEMEIQRLKQKVTHLLEDNLNLEKGAQIEVGKGAKSEIKTCPSPTSENMTIHHDDDSNAITTGKVTDAQHKSASEVEAQRINKEDAEYQELLKIQPDIDKIMERSRASYVAKIEDMMKEYPDGLEAGEFFRKHLDIVKEAKKLCEMEIRKKVPEVKPLHLASQANCLQAYADGYWRYFCEGNNINLSKKKARDEQARMSEEENLQNHLFNKLFPGRYEMIVSNNFDEYLKAIGYGMISRQLAEKCKPIVEITESGGRYTLETLTALRNIEINFALGEEFDEVDDWNNNCLTFKSTITRDGNKLIQVQKIDNYEAITVRQFFDCEMRATFSANGAFAVRVYKRL